MRYNKFYITLLILATSVFIGCSEYEDTVEPSPEVSVDNPGIQFVSENPSEFEVVLEDLSFALMVVRNNGTNELQVPVNVVADTADVFNVPETVTFPQGVDTVYLDITLKDSTPYGVPISLEVSVDDQYINPYLDDYGYYKVEVYVKPPCLHNEVTLDLVFDGYASECTWELEDGEGEIIYSGGPWADGTVSASTDFCLEDGTYTFTIYDVYGDGLSYPENGSATITFDGNVLVFIEGDFGASHSESFTLGN